MKRKLPIIIIAVAAISAFCLTMYQQQLKRANVSRTGEPGEGDAGTTGPGGGKWARKIEKPELPNLHKVSPQLYRGAQPTEAGFRELKKMGIKTVINLRSLHSDRSLLGNTKLGYKHISFKTWHPEDEDVARFLQIMSDPQNLPAFVHCQHGSDRTGTMCAIYRMAVQGWSKEEALSEMTQGGFGYHEIWKNLIDYLNALDIERVKRLATEGKGQNATDE